MQQTIASDTVLLDFEAPVKSTVIVPMTGKGIVAAST
jgi:hypothetical protein